MSKVAITLGVVALSSITSITGAYALGAFDPDYELPMKWDDSTKGSEGFKQKVLEEGCVKELFGKVTENSAAPDINSSDVPTLAEGAKGCLVVNWDKGPGANANEGKWQGTFRFLGAMKSDKKGFIVISSGDTTTDNKLKFKAFTYLTEGDDSGSGKITKKKEIKESDNKTVGKDKFPKASVELGVKNEKKEFWGLIVKDDDGTKAEALRNSNKKADREAYFRGYWTWKNDNDASTVASGWSSNLLGWGEDVFTTTVNIESAVAKVKGSWNKSVVYENIKQ